MGYNIFINIYSLKLIAIKEQFCGGINISKSNGNSITEKDYKSSKQTIAVVEEIFRNTDIDKRRTALEKILLNIIRKSEF